MPRDAHIPRAAPKIFQRYGYFSFTCRQRYGAYLKRRRAFRGARDGRAHDASGLAAIPHGRHFYFICTRPLYMNDDKRVVRHAALAAI